MSVTTVKRVSLVIAVLFLLGALIACAGMERSPGKGYWYMHKELLEADRAVEDAQKAGKDKQCPKDFAAVKDLKEKAFQAYRECRTDEAIAMAKDATNKAKALCLPVEKVAKVEEVVKKEPPAVPTKVEKMKTVIYFDFDKSNIKKEGEVELKKVIEFVKKNPGAKISIEGHTDSIGTDEYNQGLSERRANAAKNYLVKSGIDKGKMKTVGYGESKPVADNKTKQGRAKNRRAEITVYFE
ncbi:MAG: hypothetical protein FJ243_00070 [Nitrospira sp.]|nr:hypothetical protein [Nitrospira sp.]